jgi:regulator of sigma E protease
VSWLLAFVGFAVLIILHEAGHFVAAKAVGMRVERFALFFPPLLARWRPKGSETEYGIGAIPLGGYVKISGMNPAEELPPEVQSRAYYKQKPWKRIVVIAAGPFVNIAVAFLILFGLFWVNGEGKRDAQNNPVVTTTVGAGLREPAASYLEEGDRIVSVDGRRGSSEVLRKQIGSHKCRGSASPGCQAATPARVTVVRDGAVRTFAVRPVYDERAKRTLLGFSFEPATTSVGPLRAAEISVDTMWNVTTRTVTAIAEVVTPEGREQINGVVGSYEVTRQAFTFDTTRALFIIALISLSLGVVNLFPFLPLDGGHIFWAVAEKVRGRPIPFRVMERAGVVGFVLVIGLFFIGLTNDIERLNGEGFGLR